MKLSRNPYFYGIVAIAAWSTVATAFKISFHYFSLIQVLSFSVFFSFISIFFVVIIQRKLSVIKSQTTQQWLNSAALGLLNPIIYYFVLFSAYNSLPAQEAMIINYTWPILFGITSAIVAKVKISRYHIIALFISFSGLILIATKGNMQILRLSNAFGDLLALLSAVIWTIFWIFNLKDTRDVVVKLFSIFLFGSIYSVLILLFTDGFHNLNLSGLIASAYIGIFEMGITFILWLTAISLNDRPHKVSQLVYLTPFLSLVVIGLVLKEKIHLVSVIGLILIILGIIIQQKAK